MKRTGFLCLFVMLLLTGAVSAQPNDFKARTYLGVHGGPTLSMVYFLPSVPTGFQQNYMGGLMFRHINEKHLGLQVELNYSQRGWTESNGLYARRLDYIDLPFMSHLNFGRSVQFFFNIGPKIGYMISEEVLLDQTAGSQSYQYTHPVENKLDYGFVAGLGMIVEIKRQVIQLDVRANYSMSNIFSDNKRDYFDNSNLIYASATLGWLIRVN